MINKNFYNYILALQTQTPWAKRNSQRSSSSAILRTFLSYLRVGKTSLLNSYPFPIIIVTSTKSSSNPTKPPSVPISWKRKSSSMVKSSTFKYLSAKSDLGHRWTIKVQKLGWRLLSRCWLLCLGLRYHQQKSTSFCYRLVFRQYRIMDPGIPEPGFTKGAIKIPLYFGGQQDRQNWRKIGWGRGCNRIFGKAPENKALTDERQEQRGCFGSFWGDSFGISGKQAGRNVSFFW